MGVGLKSEVPPDSQLAAFFGVHERPILDDVFAEIDVKGFVHERRK